MDLSQLSMKVKHKVENSKVNSHTQLQNDMDKTEYAQGGELGSDKNL